MKKLIKITLLVYLCPFALLAQKQYADSTYSPPQFQPGYSIGTGPKIFIDEGHHNFHTKEGRYSPFVKVLERDGYRVESFKGNFSPDELSEAKVLVIANALPESSLQKWVAPTASAFSKSEIEALKKWVQDGGKLFLLADHMPMAGAAKGLAAAFGYTFYDGFADDTTTTSGAELFMKANHSLSVTELTKGARSMFAVDSVVSYTGQAFQIPKEAQSVLNCGEGWVVKLTEVAWQFNEDTEVLSAEGWSQGAYQKFGKGKIVVFGEAAMFSAQIAEIDEHRIKAGMNSPRAKNNYKLLINLVRWLDDK